MSQRILILVNSVSGGGAERASMRLARTWRDQGHDVILVGARRSLWPADTADVTVLDLGREFGQGPRGLLRSGLRLRRLLNTFRPTLVYLNCEAPELLYVLSFTWRGRHRVLVTEHSGRAWQGRPGPGRIARCVLTRFYGAAWTTVREDLPTRLSKAHAAYVANPLSPPAYSAAVSWSQQNLDCVSLSRLDPGKGSDTLLRSVAGLDGVTLTFIGQGVLRPLLEQVAMETQCDMSVKFESFTEDPWRIAHTCHVFLSGSRETAESDGLALAEALMVGMACLVSDIPAHRSFHLPDACYWRTPSELVARIVQMREDPTAFELNRQACSSRGREERNRRDPAIVAGRLLEVAGLT